MIRATVLIPTYNRGTLIAKTIRNCLNQTYKNFNILIYDDGSIDNTKYVVKSLIERYGDKIRYIKGEKNKGVGCSRKELLKNLDADYGLWLDSDDYMREDRIAKCIKYLELNKNIDIIYSFLTTFNESQSGNIHEIGISKVETSKYDKNNYDSLKYNTTCATAFFRKKLKNIEVVPLRYGSEDVLWLWKILNLGIEVGQISESLYLYRSHDARLSIEKKSKKVEKGKEEIIIHEKIKEYKNG